MKIPHFRYFDWPKASDRLVYILGRSRVHRNTYLVLQWAEVTKYLNLAKRSNFFFERYHGVFQRGVNSKSIVQAALRLNP